VETLVMEARLWRQEGIILATTLSYAPNVFPRPLIAAGVELVFGMAS
jgi:hypothetical protein